MWIFYIVLIIIILIIEVIRLIKVNKYKEEYLDGKKSALDQQLDAERKKLTEVQNQRAAAEKMYSTQKASMDAALQERQQLIDQTIKSLEEKRDTYLRSQQDFEQMQSEITLAHLQSNYEQNQTIYERTLRDTLDGLQHDMANEFNCAYDEYKNELAAIYADINEYRAKRDVINAEILRQREIDEQKDFYRICITENDLTDIELLNSLRQKLNRSAFLDKIIYDTYVSKSVKEMTKRVLGGRDPSGIYKVTNIDTNEIYVGKSVTVATRFANHVKAAYGLDGVADSQFQRALKKYGVHKFTWELLEEVPKDKLGEREKFYIEFFDSKRYGYNERLG